jgi:hypothetical protein
MSLFNYQSTNLNDSNIDAQSNNLSGRRQSMSNIFSALEVSEIGEANSTVVNTE